MDCITWIGVLILVLYITKEVTKYHQWNVVDWGIYFTPFIIIMIAFSISSFNSKK